MAKTKPISTELSKEQAMEQVGAKGIESLQLKVDENYIGEQRKQIKTFCVPHVRTHGQVVDANGSVELDCGEVVACLTQKEMKGPNPDSEAVEKFLRKKKLWEKATTLVVDPHKLKELHANGDLDENDLAFLTQITLQEAFSFRKKE